MRKEIEELLKSDITSYEIFKQTGISYGNIYKMRNGKSSIDNLTLKNAKILCEYHLRNSHKRSMNIEENLKTLLNGDITAYKIAKDLNIKNAYMIHSYITKERKIENMTLKLAEKLNEYYLKNLKKEERN